MTGFEAIPVRFFTYDYGDEIGGPDIVEVNESDFVEAVQGGAKIEYQRHSVRENGVKQICLTAVGE